MLKTKNVLTPVEKLEKKMQESVVKYSTLIGIEQMNCAHDLKYRETNEEVDMYNDLHIHHKCLFCKKTWTLYADDELKSHKDYNKFKLGN